MRLLLRLGAAWSVPAVFWVVGGIDPRILQLFDPRLGLKLACDEPDIDTLVLDGIPRTANQASLMKDIIDVKRVLHLSCPDRTELVRRLRKRALKDNRLDDASEKVIQDRLRAYDEETKPVLSYFDGIVSTIDATQPPVKVLSDMLVAIWATRSESLQFIA